MPLIPGTNPRYWTTHSQLAESKYNDEARVKYAMPDSPEEGDLLYDWAMGPTRVFRVGVVHNGEPSTVKATHTYRDGEWKPLDEDEYRVALTLKHRASEHDFAPEYDLHNAVDRAVQNTRAGRVLEHAYVREVVDAVMQTLGIAVWDRDDVREPLMVETDGMAAVRQALLEFARYHPESGYPEHIGQAGAEHDGVGFAADGASYSALINGESDGFDEAYEKPREPARFMSQAVTYAVVGGKDSGRTVQALFNNVLRAAGIDPEEASRDGDN